MNRNQINLGLHRIAENLTYTANTNPTALLMQSLNISKGNSIYDKLFELYIKQSSNLNTYSKVSISSKLCSNLLSKLVNRDKLNTLIINLKRLEQGYSIVIRSAAGELVETADFPYTERDLLDFIEQEEIPHNLVDLFEQCQPSLYYDGCIIAEIRDGRRSLNGAYKTSYILLKPSHRSILADITSLTNDQYRWSQEDRFNIESQLLVATNDPLCLDPSPVVNIAKNRLQFKRKLLHTSLLRKSTKPYTAQGLLKQRTLAKLPAPPELAILDFLQNRGNKSKYPNQTDGRAKSAAIDSWVRNEPELSPVDTSDVQKFAKELERPAWVQNAANKIDFTANIVDEYILETERPQGKLHRTRLVILQREAEDRYLGELYIERNDWDTNKCTFNLGTGLLKDKYIQQFIEIYTEEGRKQVKITHNKPGAPSQVYTSGVSQSPSATNANSQTTSVSITGNVMNQAFSRIVIPPQQSTTPPSFTSENSSQEVANAKELLSPPLTNTQPTTSMIGASAVKQLPKTALFMTKPTAQGQGLGQMNAVQIMGIQNPNASSGGQTISLQNVQGLNTLQGLQNIQVSLTNFNQNSVAVPVTLISGVSGSQPIFLSGTLSMVDHNSSSAQVVLSAGSQSADKQSIVNQRPIVVTSQGTAGGAQQILSGQHGLITIPVSLAQQLLANHNKRQQAASQSINIVSGQSAGTLSQVFSAQQAAGQQESSTPQPAAPAQSTAIQHTSTIRSQNVQIGQLLTNQQLGTSVQRAGSLQLINQPTFIQQQQQPSAGVKQMSTHSINIITTSQAAPSTTNQLYQLATGVSSINQSKPKTVFRPVQLPTPNQKDAPGN